MRISDWSSDVCSSDLDRDTTGAVPVQSLDAFACERGLVTMAEARGHIHAGLRSAPTTKTFRRWYESETRRLLIEAGRTSSLYQAAIDAGTIIETPRAPLRSEEHTSELKSTMRIS